MAQKFRLLALGATVFLLLIFFWQKNQLAPTPSPRKESPTPEPIRAKEIAATATETLPPKEKPSETLQRRIASFPKNLTTQYQKSLATDPHQAPMTVLRSALELGKIYDLATSETEARTAFDFFDRCVTQEKVIAIQTACFRYARQLSQKHSSLESDFQRLEGNTSKDVLRVVQVDGP